jgi:hypothetical protein
MRFESYLLTLCIMLPVLGWYLYTILEPRRASRLAGAGQDAVSRDPQSVRLPRRRRFPRPLARRRRIEARSVRGQQQRAGAPPAPHPLWDRWIDG